MRKQEREREKQLNHFVRFISVYFLHEHILPFVLPPFFSSSCIVVRVLFFQVFSYIFFRIILLKKAVTNKRSNAAHICECTLCSTIIINRKKCM